MTPDEHIAKMTKAINQAIKVMGDRFGSTEGDVARAIQELKASLQTSPKAVVPPVEGGAARDAVTPATGA
jgi:hypothetical protein